MPTQYYVLYAVYGVLGSAAGSMMQAMPVTSQLQALLNQNPNGVVTITNQTMGGDPALHITKQFMALVQVNGMILPFACQEGQSITFSTAAVS